MYVSSRLKKHSMHSKRPRSAAWLALTALAALYNGSHNCLGKGFKKDTHREQDTDSTENDPRRWVHLSVKCQSPGSERVARDLLG